MLIEGFAGVFALLSWALFGLALFAFVNAAIQREDAYRAADKKNKGFWLIILGIAAVVMKLFSILSILPVVGLVAVIVYIVDVRPALKQVSAGSRRTGRFLGGSKRGSSSDGPYGPFNRR